MGIWLNEMLIFWKCQCTGKVRKKAGFHTEKYGLLRKSTPLIRVYGFIRTRYVLHTYFQNPHKKSLLLTYFLKLDSSKVWEYKFPFHISWGNGLTTLLHVGPTLSRERLPSDPFLAWSGCERLSLSRIYI